MTTASQRSRRKGASFELDVLKWIREETGLRAERLRLAGKNDEGDIAVDDVGLVYVIECKNEQKISLAGYVTESITEARNYAAARSLTVDDIMPIVVIKRRGRPIGDSYVLSTLTEFFKTTP